MQVIQDLPPIIGLILGLVLLAWLVFVFLVPFMVESIRQSTRKTYEQLVALNEKLDELNAALSERSTRPPAPADPPAERGKAERRPAPPAARSGKAERRPAPEARGRREPTISETDFQNEPRPSRREPSVK